MYRELKLLPLTNETVGLIDYTTFLSINIEDYNEIATKFNGKEGNN